MDTETGRSRSASYVCVDDIGTVVNPLIVDGQVHGGLAQGIAQALYEEAVYDESGTLTTGTFADYLVPSARRPAQLHDRPDRSPATTNPLGVKGVGEAGTIASTPAVVNAIVDALRPWGVDDIEMPARRAGVARHPAGETAQSSRTSGGDPGEELLGGGRLAEGEIGLESAEDHIEGGRHGHDHDENGDNR